MSKKSSSSKNALSSTKFPGVNDEINPKDIFQYIFPAGALPNPLYNDPKHPKATPFVVVCPFCGDHTGMTTAKAYTNPVNHAMNKHFNNVEAKKDLDDSIRKAREDGGASTGIQEKLSKIWKKGSERERALFTWVKLVCLHNESIAKMTNKDFCSMLNCGKVSPPVFIKTLLELSLIVEEKIAKEMEGKKGVIMHDGWSKFARHYICLLAVYMVKTGRKLNEVEELEPVISMLTCTTLPYTSTETDENGDDIDGETLRPYLFFVRLLVIVSLTGIFLFLFLHSFFCIFI